MVDVNIEVNQAIK